MGLPMKSSVEKWSPVSIESTGKAEWNYFSLRRRTYLDVGGALRKNDLYCEVLSQEVVEVVEEC
jgi:hypothetical protein